MATYNFSPRLSDRYTLIAPDGARAVFNDPSDIDYVGMLTSISGLESADVRESADDLVEADGGVHGNFYYGRRSIVLEGSIFNHLSVAERDARVQRLRAASNALRSDALLYWEPGQSAAANWVTDPSAESNALNSTTTPPFTVAFGTIGYQTAQAYGFGSRGYLVTNTSGATNDVSVQSAQTKPIQELIALQGTTGDFSLAAATPPAQSVYVTARARTPTGGATRNFRVEIDFYARGSNSPRDGGASDILLTTATSSWVSTSTTAWNVASVNTSMLPLAAYAKVNIVFQGMAAGETQYLDAIEFGPGTANTATYIDGETGGWYWWGSRYRSPSAPYIPISAFVRRQSRLSVSGGWVKDFQIPLVAADSYLQSLYVHSEGATGGATTVTLPQRGDTPAWPVVTIHGPITDPGFQAPNYNAMQLVGVTLNSTQSLIFDVKARTVRLNGSPSILNINNYLNWSTSNWPKVDPGTPVFTLLGTGIGGATSMTVAYRDTWV